MKLLERSSQQPVEAAYELFRCARMNSSRVVRADHIPSVARDIEPSDISDVAAGAESRPTVHPDGAVACPGRGRHSLETGQRRTAARGLKDRPAVPHFFRAPEELKGSAATRVLWHLADDLRGKSPRATTADQHIPTDIDSRTGLLHSDHRRLLPLASDDSDRCLVGIHAGDLDVRLRLGQDLQNYFQLSILGSSELGANAVLFGAIRAVGGNRTYNVERVGNSILARSLPECTELLGAQCPVLQGSSTDHRRRDRRQLADQFIAVVDVDEVVGRLMLFVVAALCAGRADTAHSHGPHPSGAA